MKTPAMHKISIDTDHYYVLNPIPPYVDIILHNVSINEKEFTKMAALSSSYQNDPRLVEMVRKAGDASAKVPYLMAAGETPASILEALREVAKPHVDYLRDLPGHMRVTIEMLLSINKIPMGCEDCGIPALLEIDRIQGEMIQTLREMMAGRELPETFRAANLAALSRLDQDWPRLRRKVVPSWSEPHPLPEQAAMRYQPVFVRGRLAYLFETCVMVDSPLARELLKFTPPVLQRPIPENQPVPATGSAEWLIRDTGKIGRHFTRALLNIIKDRLEAEKISLDAHNYHRINQEARDALQDFVGKTP